MRYQRSVQRIGSSMLVSLPKEWIVRNGLDKGSMLTIDVNNDIIIHSPKKENKDMIINYPSELVSKEITGAYLLGYDIIQVKGNNVMSYNDRELIKKSIERLVGLEIVDEDAYNIKSQFLLDAYSLDPTKILQRMNSIITGMYKDTIRSFIDRNNSMLRIVAIRDEEVNRQYFLLVRFLRSALLDTTLAERLNLSSIDILDYRIAANLFESIGDSIVELANIILNSQESMENVMDVALLIQKIQSLSINAFLNNNKMYFIQVINEYNRLVKMLDEVKRSNVSILNIIYMLDRIARLWVDVVDLVKIIPNK